MSRRLGPMRVSSLSMNLRANGRLNADILRPNGAQVNHHAVGVVGKFMVSPNPLSLRRSQGFTLIELVISAALMSLILVSGYLCLSSSLASQRLIHTRSDTLQAGRVALTILSADLRGACPLSKDIQFLGMSRTLDGASTDNLDFGTHHYAPHREREGDFCQVSYFVLREPQSGQLGLWRRSNPLLGVEPLSGGRREEICRGLLGLRFEYYDGILWYDTWGDPTGQGKAQASRREQPNLTGMPEAVRVTLRLDSDLASGHSRGTGAADKTRISEPPLVLQTVVRLNWAGASRSSSAGRSITNSTNAPAATSPTEGGNQ